MKTQAKMIKRINTPEGYLVATATTENGYFSVTGEIWSSRRTYISQNEAYWICGGCIHEEIRKYLPEFRPLIRMHLSNLEGMPMHAVANGYYYYQHPEEFGVKTLARHLRITEDAAIELCKALDQEPDPQKRKLQFSAYVSAQIERWKTEADEAINLIKGK